MRLFPTFFLPVVSLVAFLPQAQATLSITMNYTSFDTGPTAGTALSDILKNDSWTGSTTDADKLTTARGVMDTAVSMIENLFSGATGPAVTQTINVGWESHSGNTLATGGTNYFVSAPNYPFGSGSLNWDMDGTSTFFVDSSPLNNSEFSASTPSTRTIDLNGFAINAENRYYANFAGTDAGNNTDMLSVAIHEIMHAVGVLGGYPKFADLDIGSDGDLDLVANGATYQVAFSGGHTSETLPWDGPGTLGGSYYPNVIGPAIVTGTRGLLTDVDTLLLANIHDQALDDYALVNQPFGTVPTLVPEPQTAILTLLALLPLFRRKR